MADLDVGAGRRLGPGLPRMRQLVLALGVLSACRADDPAPASGATIAAPDSASPSAASAPPPSAASAPPSASSGALSEGGPTPAPFRDPKGRFEVVLLGDPKVETTRPVVDGVAYVIDSFTSAIDARMHQVIALTATDPPRHDCSLAIDGSLSRLANMGCTSRSVVDRPLGSVLGREAAFDCVDGARGLTWVLCDPKRVKKDVVGYQLVAIAKPGEWNEAIAKAFLASFALKTVGARDDAPAPR